jgi:hypothetical protein
MLSVDQQFPLILVGRVQLDIVTIDAGRRGRDREPATRPTSPGHSHGGAGT